MNTLHEQLTDAFTDSLSHGQLLLLSREADSTHTTEWKETSENKMWRINGSACRLSPCRILVWSHCEEAGINDVNIVDGDDAEQAATDHAHAIASNLDGRGVIGYVIAIVSKWERDSDKPREVTEDTVYDRLQEWIDGDGDADTVCVATALCKLI